MSEQKEKNDPKVGDIIYVRPNRIFTGGKSHIRRVYQDMSAGKMMTFVEVDEVRCIGFRWENSLENEQNELRRKFGEQWARRRHSI